MLAVDYETRPAMWLVLNPAAYRSTLVCGYGMCESPSEWATYPSVCSKRATLRDNLIVPQRNVARERNLAKPQRVKTGQVDQRVVAPALCGRGHAVLRRRPSMIRPLVPANSSDRRDNLRLAAE